MDRAAGQPGVAVGGGEAPEHARRHRLRAQSRRRGPVAARDDGAAAEQRLEGPFGTAARIAAEHRVADHRHDQQVRARDRSRDFAGARRRCAQILGAAQDQRRDRGQLCRQLRLERRRVRPARALRYVAEPDRVAGAERGERAGTERERRRPGFGEPLARARGAAPREGLVFAARREVQRLVEAFPAAFFGRNRLEQPPERRDVAEGRRARGGDEGRAQRPREVAEQQHVQQRLGGREQMPRAPLGSDGPNRQRAVVHARDDPPQVRQRVGRHAAARAPLADRAQHPRQGLEGRPHEGIGAGRRHDRVQDQPFDVLRVGLGVHLGELRAVAGAVEDELFVAARLTDRLDVGDAVGRRVEAPARPELRGARRDQPRGGAEPAAPLQSRARERVREPDAALVEHDQIAGGGDRTQQFGELFRERDRLLPWAAGERHDRAPRFADRRPVATDRERDRAGHRAGRVERDRELRAREVVALRARRERDLRARLRRGHPQRGRDQRGRARDPHPPASSHCSKSIAPAGAPRRSVGWAP